MLKTRPKNDYNYSYYTNKNTKSKNKSQQKKNTKIVLTFILSLFLIAVIIVFYIGQSVKNTQLNFQLADLKRELEQINKKNYRLNLQLAKDRSLAKVEQIARTKLQMVDPERIEVVVLNDNENEQILEDKKVNDSIFLAEILSNFLEKIGTVKAGTLE